MLRVKQRWKFAALLSSISLRLFMQPNMKSKSSGDDSRSFTTRYRNSARYMAIDDFTIFPYIPAVTRCVEASFMRCNSPLGGGEATIERIERGCREILFPPMRTVPFFAENRQYDTLPASRVQRQAIRPLSPCSMVCNTMAVLLYSAVTLYGFAQKQSIFLENYEFCLPLQQIDVFYFRQFKQFLNVWYLLLLVSGLQN